MATYSVQPIDYVSENLFSAIPAWEIVNGAAARLYFQLLIDDVLGTRRYLLAPASQVSLSFIRSRAPSVGSSSTVITKYATMILPVSDKSIFQVDLSATEASQVVTGGVRLTITTSGTEVSFNLPHIVKKVVALPGF